MRKIAGYFLKGLLALLGVALLYAYIAYPAAYVNRLLRWGEAYGEFGGAQGWVELFYDFVTTMDG